MKTFRRRRAGLSATAGLSCYITLHNKNSNNNNNNNDNIFLQLLLASRQQNNKHIINDINSNYRAIGREHTSSDTSVAICRIITVDCYRIKMHYGGENGRNGGKVIRAAANRLVIQTRPIPSKNFIKIRSEYFEIFCTETQSDIQTHRLPRKHNPSAEVITVCYRMFYIGRSRRHSKSTSSEFVFSRTTLC